MTATGWTVVFATAAVDDLSLIEDHLIRAYCAFGESPTEAARHAETRIEAIIATAERLATAPFRGAAQEDLLPGLRHLVLDGAIYWFLPDADTKQVRVLAVFFGGQDHQRHMLVRLLRKDGS
ncbi:type II toxin-antitoxin system RelE/ParE family toxin [Tabrizicola sp.]|jgi:plasmid stabilization system protein ParE|uniref:type II toxin-antitoxin system RelE/ParE family toxin n=1 Tax=Tabrizicola sp. TaxID=2005166 RepID=UPI0035B038D0